MDKRLQPGDRIRSRWAAVLGALTLVSVLLGCGTPPAPDPAPSETTARDRTGPGDVWVEPWPRVPVDGDGDGLYDDEDNCPAVSNARQDDYDRDGTGDACDACPERSGSSRSGCPGAVAPPSDMTRAEWRAHFAGTDWDGDGIPLPGDLCPLVASSNEGDRDGDGWGDACDRCADSPAPRSADRGAARHRPAGLRLRSPSGRLRHNGASG